ncbi:hypothetical protein RRF57_006556 [Xylaria bambusicola]|uniref:Uncharacterized protein n=1 Tax=Xylaria bambusicola TaxID=326684 RepID=A0AAN7UQG3_9PEZI
MTSVQTQAAADWLAKLYPTRGNLGDCCVFVLDPNFDPNAKCDGLLVLPLCCALSRVMALSALHEAYIDRANILQATAAIQLPAYGFTGLDVVGGM